MLRNAALCASASPQWCTTWPAAHTEYKHPFLNQREIKRAGIVAISTDRGLCGGLNTNMFKKALNHIGELDDKGVEIEVVTFGTKALGILSSVSVPRLLPKPVTSATARKSRRSSDRSRY